MKEKLKLELIKKYSGQATKEYLENLAERLAEKLEKEEDIEGIMTELENSPVRIGDLQTEGDRRVAKLKKELEELKKKPEPPKEPPKPPEKDDEVAKQIAELKKQIEDDRKDRQRQAARAKLMERIKDKQIPKALTDDIVVDSVDEVDEVFEKLVEKSEAIRKELGTSDQEPPRKGDPPVTSKKQIIEDLQTIKPR